MFKLYEQNPEKFLKEKYYSKLFTVEDVSGHDFLSRKLLDGEKLGHPPQNEFQVKGDDLKSLRAERINGV